MGLVKFGGGIVQISGSIAGTVHARNRFGNYIRPRTKPVNPRSDRQETVRATLSFLAEYWHGDLTDVQRGLWNTYAAAVAMTNRIGETIHLTGFNHFMRSNAFLRALVPGTAPPGAPTILNLPEKDDTAACSEEDIAAQTFTFTCDDTGWGINPDDKSALAIYQGQPQLASRNFFAGPWRLIGFFDVAAGGAGTDTFDAGFSFALDQKVWFQARMRDSDGRCSTPWGLSPRTIVADV